MKLAVVTTPEADEQIHTIDRWWRANRTAAPDLFAEELGRCFQLLARAPRLGRSYRRHPAVRGIRRILLRSSRYHVYYVERADVVAVLAVWHSHRGQAPPL